MIITGKKFSKPEMSRVINGDTVLDEAPEEIPKERLDILLVNKYKSYNRSTLQKFIELGYVTVDGVVAKKPNQKCVADVKLDLRVPEDIKNADLKPDVIYEDNNQKRWLLGYDNPVTATSLGGETGTAFGDANQYTIELTDNSSELPMEVTMSNTDFEALLDANL